MTDAVARRAAGKTAVGAKIIWSLDLGAIVARCLVEEPGRWLVQVRTEGRWRDLTSTAMPWLALRRLVDSAAARSSVQDAMERARELATDETPAAPSD